VLGHAYAFEVDGGLFDSGGRFEEYVGEALDSLPPDLHAQMSNVEIVVEVEPPPGQRLLGLYQGVPLTKRGPCGVRYRYSVNIGEIVVCGPKR
jgi:predicted Zn-dependent protease with MMP-like domain